MDEATLKRALAALIGFRALVDVCAKGKDVDNISGAHPLYQEKIAEHPS